MTPSTASRLCAAVRALPVSERERHLQGLAALLHLLAHCPEGREPCRFVAGARAYRSPVLQWAAETLRRPWVECPATDCAEPGHVTLVSIPVEQTTEGAR